MKLMSSQCHPETDPSGISGRALPSCRVVPAQQQAMSLEKLNYFSSSDTMLNGKTWCLTKQCTQCLVVRVEVPKSGLQQPLINPCALIHTHQWWLLPCKALTSRIGSNWSMWMVRFRIWTANPSTVVYYFVRAVADRTLTHQDYFSRDTCEHVVHKQFPDAHRMSKQAHSKASPKLVFQPLRVVHVWQKLQLNVFLMRLPKKLPHKKKLNKTNKINK